MKTFAATSIVALTFLPGALAHGFVRVVTIGGTQYHGPEPGSKGKSTDVIREINNTNPNHLGDAGADLACGRGAATRPAAAKATGKAGDTIKWTWDAGDGSPWPHNQGPIMTYMAKCDPDCDMDATKAKWFKIDEVGKTKTPGNTWVQAQLMKGKDYSTTIPTGVPSGDYLIRHEIIALHLADHKNGAEFYPSCSQVTITGGASASTDVGATVSFPGEYKETDPGIYINIWDKLGAYPYPGPAVTTFNGTSTTDSGSSSDSTITTTSATGTATTSSAASTATASSSDDNGDDGDDGDSGSSDDNGDDDGCTDDGDDGDDGDNTSDSGSGASSGTTTLNGSSDATTVTVTVTVTTTPSSCATTSASKKANYARAEPTTPAKARRSRRGHDHSHTH